MSTSMGFFTFGSGISRNATGRLELHALQLAYQAHNGQLRKYTLEPYITHPIAVAGILKAGMQRPPSDIMLAAALLHDTLEDTSLRKETILCKCGVAVLQLVEELTDATTLSDGNRAFRKAREAARLATVSPVAKTIKLADIIDNTPSIVQHAKPFARVYVHECTALLEALRDPSDLHIWMRAARVVRTAQEEVA